jgi:hypothetical protein
MVTGQWRTAGGVWGLNPPPPPPKFRSFDKAEPNSQFRGKYIRNNQIRIRVSLICKLSGTPDLGSYRPQILVFSALCSQLNLLNPPAPRTKFLGRHCSRWPKHVGGLRRLQCNKFPYLHKHLLVLC